jgi:hypothetical protein
VNLPGFPEWLLGLPQRFYDQCDSLVGETPRAEVLHQYDIRITNLSEFEMPVDERFEFYGWKYLSIVRPVRFPVAEGELRAISLV